MKVKVRDRGIYGDRIMKRRNFLVGALIGLSSIFTVKKSSAYNTPGLCLENIVGEINKYGYKVDSEHRDQKLEEISFCQTHKEFTEDIVRVWKVTNIHNREPMFYVQKFIFGTNMDGNLYNLNTQCYLTDNWKKELYTLINMQPERLC